MEGVSRDKRHTTTTPALDDGRGTIGSPGELCIGREGRELGSGHGGDRGDHCAGGKGGYSRGPESTEKEEKHGRPGEEVL